MELKLISKLGSKVKYSEEQNDRRKKTPTNMGFLICWLKNMFSSSYRQWAAAQAKGFRSELKNLIISAQQNLPYVVCNTYLSFGSY